MSQPVTVESSSTRPISSGPMSAGMIQLRPDQHIRRRNDSTEHVCMFSVCLMFIGVPIIVIGIIFLSFFSPFGVILMVIGVIASSSGAILAILSAIISIFSKGPEINTSNANYVLNETPNINIGRTQYNEDFAINNTPQQLSTANLPIVTDNDTEILDTQQWSNFPEVQNPKSYLNSFGELPKISLSPRLPDSLDVRTKSYIRAKYDKNSKRKLPKLKMSIKRKTMSRTELTKESLDEIHTTSSSSSSSPIYDSSLSHRKSTEESDDILNRESIITIENHNLTSDNHKNDSSDVNKIVNMNKRRYKLKQSENSSRSHELSDEFEKIDIIEPEPNFSPNVLDTYGNLLKSFKNEDKIT